VEEVRYVPANGDGSYGFYTWRDVRKPSGPGRDAKLEKGIENEACRDSNEKDGNHKGRYQAGAQDCC